MTVENDTDSDGFKPLIIELGEAQIRHTFSAEQLNLIKDALVTNGYLREDQLSVENQKKELADKIKATIIEMVYNTEILPSTKYSHYISKKLNYSYNYLTTVFAEIKGITIENFIILHKIEKVKDLIIYSRLNLSEIAVRMQYSSISHLSSQFKKVTGLTPSQYKKIKQSSQSAA